MKRTRIRKNFTLVELIAVVAIAGILLVLLVPALNSMTAGNKVDMCASRLKLGMEQAASKAATARKYVALVLPHKAPNDDLKRFCYGGYRLAFVKKNGSEWEFVKWVPENDWKNARDGAALVQVVDTKPATADAGVPSGTELTCATAVIDTGSKLKKPADGKSYADSWDKDNPMLVFSPYGGTANDKPLYFVVTEIKDNGDALAYANKANTVILKLNPLTGRVEYVRYE